MNRRMMTRQGDAVDQIAQEVYGRTAGTTEALLDANPVLAGLPARLPAGIEVILPELVAPVVVPTVRLWD